MTDRKQPLVGFLIILASGAFMLWVLTKLVEVFR
jgi:hypothetical protein